MCYLPGARPNFRCFTYIKRSNIPNEYMIVFIKSMKILMHTEVKTSDQYTVVDQL